MQVLFDLFLLLARFSLPVITVLFVFCCAKKLLKKSPTIPIASIRVDGMRELFDVNGCECILGRSRICDIRLNLATVSRRHAVLTFSKDYGFKINTVNGKKGKIDRDIYYIRVRAADADRVREILRRNGITAGIDEDLMTDAALKKRHSYI